MDKKMSVDDDVQNGEGFVDRDIYKWAANFISDYLDHDDDGNIKGVRDVSF
jgi:hypothetical protein